MSEASKGRWGARGIAVAALIAAGGCTGEAPDTAAEAPTAAKQEDKAPTPSAPAPEADETEVAAPEGQVAGAAAPTAGAPAKVVDFAAAKREAPADPAAGAVAPGTAVSAASTGRVRPAKPVKPTGESLEAYRQHAKRFRAALAAGREAVRAKDYDAGRAALERALRLDPNHPGALGELGYAHYLAGDHDEARRFTQRALQVARAPRRRAALLYNLGRVHEDAGEAEAAARVYRRSLSLRPNATVRARLDGLKAPADVDAPDAPTAVCDGLHELWDCPPASEDADGRCTCEVGRREDVDGDVGALRGAAVIELEGHTFGIVDTDELAVRTPSGWYHVTELVNGWTPGAFGIHNEGEITAWELGDHHAGAGAELLVRTSNTLVDTDLGYNAFTEETVKHLVHCWSADGAVRCLSMVTGRTSSIGKIDEEGDTPPEKVYGPLGERTWSVDATISRAGELVVKVTRGEVPKEVRALVGRTPLAKLGDKPGWVELSRFR